MDGTLLNGNRLAITQSRSNPISKGLILPIIVIGVCYWFVDQSWAASEYFSFLGDYTGSVNLTADRVEAVNFKSTLARISLGIFGGYCLLTAPRRSFKLNSPLLILLSLYALFLAGSTLWSINPRVTAQKCVVLAFAALGAVGIARTWTLRELIIVFATVSVLHICVGVLAELSLGNFTPYKSDYRFVGTSHPNKMAGYGAICCLGAVAFSRNRSQLGVWTFAVLAVGFVALVLTKSRTSLAGVIIAMIALRFVTIQPRIRVFVVSSTVFVVACLGVFLAVASTSTWNAVSEVLVMGRNDNVKTLTGRLPLWEELASSIQDRPVLGHGYLAFWQKDKVESLSDFFGWEIPHGHNMYLDIALDGGMVGLAMFLGIVGLAFHVAIGIYKRNQDIGVAFVICYLVFALIHGAGESLFKAPTFLMFVLLTCLIRLALIDCSNRS